jgi:hypothetical protein
MHPVTTWLTRGTRKSASRIRGSGRGVLALARLISGVIYARLRAAPQRQRLSFYRQAVHATYALKSVMQTLRD